MSRRIFISCVSDEFHRTKEGAFFSSYRTELAADLRLHGYQHTTQEDLLDGTGDLLELIEIEVQRCDAIVHLIGQMAGGYPKVPAVERLLKKHPDFLADHPELRASIGVVPTLSYTQWEIYLALHFGIKSLIYLIDEKAERSPFNAPTPESIEAQTEHLQRLENEGLARRRVEDHQRLCRRVPPTLNYHFNPDSRGPLQDPIDEWTGHLADRLVRDTPFRPVQFEDPDTARDAALKTLAATTAYSADQILGILEEHRATLEETVFDGLKGESNLWDLALAYAAEGRFDRAAKIAERAAYRAEEENDTEAAIDTFQFAAHAYTRGYHHVLAVEAFEKACNRTDREADPLRWARFQQSLGKFLRDTGQISKAEKPIRSALEVFEEKLGSEHLDALCCRLDLAKWLLDAGNPAGAEAASGFILRTIETWTDENQRHILLTAALDTYGRALQHQGQLDEAEPILRTVLEIEESRKGPEHPHTLISVNNLARLLESKGDLAEVEPLYRRALEATERVLGPEHPHTLTSVNNLAHLLGSKGDFAEAEPLNRRALETSERVLGQEHPNTLSSMNNLAGLLEDKGDLAEAEPLYRRSLEAWERVLGPEHPDTLRSVNNLAFLLQAKCDLAEAEPLYRRALEASERVLGPEHPNTLTSVNNLAGLLCEKGDLAEAETLICRALEGREQVIGSDHPETLKSVRWSAEILEKKGDLKAAETLYQRSYEGLIAKLGAQHPYTQKVKLSWERCRVKMKKAERE